MALLYIAMSTTDTIDSIYSLSLNKKENYVFLEAASKHNQDTMHNRQHEIRIHEGNGVRRDKEL